ncbi:MAG: hypothetical protein OXC10_00415 [Rhodospirillaceae bacterium]|nr:hypothetical protein [Rhodospirillaceae bacterium]
MLNVTKTEGLIRKWAMTLPLLLFHFPKFSSVERPRLGGYRFHRNIDWLLAHDSFSKDVVKRIQEAPVDGAVDSPPMPPPMMTTSMVTSLFLPSKPIRANYQV